MSAHAPGVAPEAGSSRPGPVVSPGEEYWFRDLDPGAFEDWLFFGQDGLDRLSGPSRFSADPAVAFQARLSRVQLDHVALELFAAAPHRSVRDRAAIEAEPVELLDFVQVQQGRLRVEAAGAAFDLRAGEACIVDSREPVTCSTDGDVRLLRAVVGLEHIPEHLRRTTTTSGAPLAPTPLVESFVSFAATVLRSASNGGVPGPFLIRAIADLQSAVLAEAQHASGPPTGAAAIRSRIEEHIDRHLTDPDLSPRSIAAALGISLRHVHGVFNEGDRTIARSIRDRRLAAIGIELRTAVDRVRLDELAARYAFPSGEAMGRAFRERFGRSPSAYRMEGHRPADAPPAAP